jgi:AraC family transcriptional regulator
VRVRPAWLDRAVDRLRAEFADPPSIALLAADAAVHRSHFVRVFHAHQRCTVGEFVRRQRVDWACAQLSSRCDVSISEVALHAGFADQAHFTRVFRRVTGQTPGQYRRLQPPPDHR